MVTHSSKVKSLYHWFNSYFPICCSNHRYCSEYDTTFWYAKETIHESEKRIYSAANSKSPAQMLIANEIGNNSNNYVMVYKDNKDDTKATAHFKPKTTKEDISESTKNRLIMKHLMTIMLR